MFVLDGAAMVVLGANLLQGTPGRIGERGETSSVLAEKQLCLVPWDRLRAGGGNASGAGEDLRMLLFAEGDADDGAYERLDNEVESQGDLFQCAPAVVSVIVAAVAEGSIPAANLASVLDVLGRVVAGYPDRDEVAAGNGDLREQCHAEAMKGYWSLLRVAVERDSFNAWRVARDVVSALDEEHSRRILK
ncbi:hypothetical protein ASE27_05930 [Oerskovia sp. Root918]|jgi:hypothetical protein|nr:hypothetical protein ASE27_05930 [Oerskovia sp. Root918]